MIATMNSSSAATPGATSSPKVFPMLRKVRSQLSFQQLQQNQNSQKNTFRRTIIRGRSGRQQKNNSSTSTSSSGFNSNNNNYSPSSADPTLSDDAFSIGGGADIESIQEDDDDGDNGDKMQELINNFQGSNSSFGNGLGSSIKSGTTNGSDSSRKMKKSVSFSSFNSMKRVPSLLDLLPESSNKDEIWFGRNEFSKFAQAEMSRRGSMGITSTSALDSSVPQNDIVFPDNDENDDDDSDSSSSDDSDSDDEDNMLIG